MIEQVMKCEQFEQCGSKVTYDPLKSAYLGDCLPSEWLIVLTGNPRDHEALHFCSRECLRHWAMPMESDWDKLSKVQKAVVQEEREQTIKYLDALVELVKKQNPRLEIVYQFSLDALLREE